MNDSNGSVSSYFEECPDPSLCTVPNFEDNIPLAFGLTIAAGLATVLGAIPPLLPCIKHTNRRLLSGSLSVAAGVMLYVSFTEILLKASNNFCCLTNRHFTLATVGCFFGGILVTVILDSLVHLLERFDQSVMKRKCFSCVSHTVCKVCCKQKNKGREKPCSDGSVNKTNKLPVPSDGSVNKTNKLPVPSDSSMKQCPMDMEDGMYNGDSPSISRDEDNIGEVLEFSVNSSDVPHSSDVGFSDTESARVSGSGSSSSSFVRRPSYLSMVENAHSTGQPPSHQEEADTAMILANVSDASDVRRLKRTGVLTCLAIGIHNFPEGLATFVATTSSPAFGAALAIAIALHNVPEGLTVAMPIFYATKSRWKAFLFAAISGLAEPVGALCGWLVLKNSFGPVLYGICFGLVGGMMVYISLAELLRTSLRFDPKGHIAISCLVAGMFVMAVSLLLFVY